MKQKVEGFLQRKLQLHLLKNWNCDWKCSMCVQDELINVQYESYKSVFFTQKLMLPHSI